jgi:hypothetical protein
MGGGGKGGGSQVIGYKYYLGMHMVVCHGPVDLVGPIYAGERQFTDTVSGTGQAWVFAPGLFGGEKKEGGIIGYLDILFGESTQAQNAYLVSQLGSNVPAYRGVVSLVSNKMYVCAMSPYPKPWAITVTRIPGQDWYSSKAFINQIGGAGQASANGAHMLREAIMNTDWGMGYPGSAIDDTSFMEAADTLYDEGLGLSMILAGQGSVEEFMQQILRHINGVVYTDRLTGKFVLKLTREDYVIGDLPVFDTSNVKELSSFQRPTYGEMINEVVIVYRPRGAFSDAAVTFQDLASVQAQGSVISQTLQYPGIDNAANASIIGVRELKQNSTPLAKARIVANRDAWNLNPGDPFVFTWDPKGIDRIVMRAMSLSYGNLAKGDIEINAVEDIFGVPSSAYTTPQDSLWTDPVGDPVVSPELRLEEVPYWDLKMRLSPADFAYVEDTDCYVHALAREPSVTGPSYGIWTDPAGTGTFAKVSNGVYPPTVLLAQDLSKTQEAGILITSVTWLAEIVNTGSYAYIGDEIVRVDDLDPVAGTMDAGRGCLDSAPCEHASGTRVWFAELKGGNDVTPYLPTEDLDVRVTPVTGRGELDVASAPTENIVFVGRFFKPYPAGRFAFNSVYYPSAITGALALTWVHRDRTLQDVRPIVDHFDGSIGPEVGTTYTAKLYGESDLVTTPLRTYSGVSGLSQSWTDELTDSNIWVYSPVDTYDFLLPLDTNARVEGPAQTVGWASNVTDVTFDGDFAEFPGTGYMDVEDIDIGETVSVVFGVRGGSYPSGAANTVVDKSDAAGANIFALELNSGYVRVYLGSGGLNSGDLGGSIDWTNDHYFLVTVEKDAPAPGQSEVTVYMDGAQTGQATVNTVIGSMAGKSWAVGAGWSGAATRYRYLTADIHRLGFWGSLLAVTDVWPEQRLNSELRATLTTVRSGEDSRMDCDHTADRAGFGYHFGEHYGGA